MPEVLTRLRPPRFAAAPASPALGELWADTDDNTLYWWNGSAWVPAKDAGIVPAIPLVSSLPGSPVDGQECYYLADATLGVIWHLRYRAASASAYKWEVVGAGNWLYHYVATEEGFVTSTAWNKVASGPLITVPLAGDYEYFSEAHFYTSGSQVATALGLAPSTTTPSYPHICNNNYTVASAGGNFSAHHGNVITGLAASTVLQQFYSQYATTGSNPHMRFRSLRVRAVRVG